MLAEIEDIPTLTCLYLLFGKWKPLALYSMLIALRGGNNLYVNFRRWDNDLGLIEGGIQENPIEM